MGCWALAKTDAFGRVSPVDVFARQRASKNVLDRARRREDEHTHLLAHPRMPIHIHRLSVRHRIVFISVLALQISSLVGLHDRQVGGAPPAQATATRATYFVRSRRRLYYSSEPCQRSLTRISTARPRRGRVCADENWTPAWRRVRRQTSTQKLTAAMVVVVVAGAWRNTAEGVLVSVAGVVVGNGGHPSWRA